MTAFAIDLTPIIAVVLAGILAVGLVRLAVSLSQRHARKRTRILLKAPDSTRGQPQD